LGVLGVHPPSGWRWKAELRAEPVQEISEPSLCSRSHDNGQPMEKSLRECSECSECLVISQSFLKRLWWKKNTHLDQAEEKFFVFLKAPVIHAAMHNPIEIKVPRIICGKRREHI
jgi:hypothetical protein